MFYPPQANWDFENSSFPTALNSTYYAAISPSLKIFPTTCPPWLVAKLMVMLLLSVLPKHYQIITNCNETLLNILPKYPNFTRPTGTLV